MIQMQPNARYVILGEDRAHASLTELVQHHQTVGIQPFMEILTVPCGQVNVQDPQWEKRMGHGLCHERVVGDTAGHLFCVPVERCPILAKQLDCFCVHWEMLGSPGVGERHWQVGDALLPPECQQWIQLDISLHGAVKCV